MAHLAERLIRPPGRPLIGAPLGLAIALASCHGPTPQSSSRQSYTVEPRSFDVTAGLVGTIGAAGEDEVASPFDGVIQSVDVEFGRTVAAGQVLFVMDTGELVQRVRDARSGLLKSAEAEAETRDWQASPDMARARRGVTSAEGTLKSLEAKIATTKALLDRGLVSRDEYEGLLEQQATSQLSLASAQDDLAASLKKGSASAREITEMDLLNMRVKLAELQAQLAHARVIAPAAGVVIQPIAAKASEADVGLHPGAHVQRGEVVAEIARAGDLAVTVKLDEADANAIQEGRLVTVTGPGFPGLVLKGHVFSVSNQALAPDAAGAATGGGITFPATILLDPLTPNQARLVRIGMSANVTITVHHADAALVVPLQAVQGAAPNATVLVVNPQTGKPQPRLVSIGGVSSDGVEITSGLKPGDTVTWQVAKASSSTN